MNTLRLTDKTEVRAFLNRDRHLMAYALGDLDDAFWPESIFYGAWSDGQLVSLVLLYCGLDPPVLTAFGEAAGVRAIFETQPLPEEIYYLFLPEMESVLTGHYEQINPKREWRMVLDPGAFRPPSLHGVTRLGPEHAETLAALFRYAAEPGEEIVAFSPWQLAHGAFYGIWHHGALVASAGTHVWSETEGIAAIGNVFTQPEYRGRGYATICTAAVASEALAAGIATVVLNVRHDNTPAIHVYEKLGFRLYHTFLEGPAWVRSAP